MVVKLEIVPAGVRNYPRIDNMYFSYGPSIKPGLFEAFIQ